MREQRSAVDESGGAGENAAMSGARHILVVDDNRDAAELMAEALEFQGFVTAVAFDGPAALETARGRRFDAAILDIGLPVMDGFELAIRLRELDGTLVLIAITGYGQDSDFERSRRAGFNAHMVKPVTATSVAQELTAAFASVPPAA